MDFGFWSQIKRYLKSRKLALKIPPTCFLYNKKSSVNIQAGDMDSNWKLICPPCMPEKSSTERNGALSWIGSRIIWPCQNRAQEQFCCRCVGCLQLRAGGKSKKLQNLTGVTSNLDSFPICLSTVNDNLLTWNKEWRNVKYDWQKYLCLLGTSFFWFNPF